MELKHIQSELHEMINCELFRITHTIDLLNQVSRRTALELKQLTFKIQTLSEKIDHSE